MKIRITILIGLILLISCSKSNDVNNGKIVNSAIQQTIDINSNDTLNVNLGNFGDEEGAWIFKAPKNAKISKVYRQIDYTSMIYEYSPNNNFIGKDTVVLILNTGSDGAGLGRNDTTAICINVR